MLQLFNFAMGSEMMALIRADSCVRVWMLLTIRLWPPCLSSCHQPPKVAIIIFLK